MGSSWQETTELVGKLISGSERSRIVYPWSNGMSVHEARGGTNLLSALALIIAGGLGAGIPMALVIIWVCA